MKGRILEILKQEQGVVSGEELSSRLGISRVSIWKHIRKIQELGYDIVSGPKGYHLGSDRDLLYPWEFPGREHLIHHFQSVPSTMDVARDLARKCAEELSVVVADSQEQGRGRMRRKWYSDGGGLYFTMILRPNISPASSFLVNFIASSVLAETVRELTGIDAMVKWPNDILVDGKKLSGMLSEMEAEGDTATFVNIGIGVNVNNDPTPDEPTATSIAKLLGRTIKRRDLLAAYLDNLSRRFAEKGVEDAVSDWKQHTMTIGREVKIVTVKDTSEGVALDVDETGALILELADGSTKRVIYGDCFHR